MGYSAVPQTGEMPHISPFVLPLVIVFFFCINELCLHLAQIAKLLEKRKNHESYYSKTWISLPLFICFKAFSVFTFSERTAQLSYGMQLFSLR